MKGGDGEVKTDRQPGTGLDQMERQGWDRIGSGREMGRLQPRGSVSRVRQERQGKAEGSVPANKASSGHSGHSVGPELEPNRQ